MPFARPSPGGGRSPFAPSSSSPSSATSSTQHSPASTSGTSLPHLSSDVLRTHDAHLAPPTPRSGTPSGGVRSLPSAPLNRLWGQYVAPSPRGSSDRLATYGSSPALNGGAHVSVSGGSSFPVGLGLATGYDASSAVDQLEQMAREAAESTSASSASSTRQSAATSPAAIENILPLLKEPNIVTHSPRRSPVIFNHFHDAQPGSTSDHDSRQGGTDVGPSALSHSFTASSIDGDVNSPAQAVSAQATSRPIPNSTIKSYSAGQVTSIGSLASSPPSSSSSSSRPFHKKQKVFAMSSDDEDDEVDDVVDGAKRAAFTRASRGDPIRRSISALSGVTVIGKGVMRREGSSSTVGSRRSNGSISLAPDETSNNMGSTARSRRSLEVDDPTDGDSTHLRRQSNDSTRSSQASDQREDLSRTMRPASMSLRQISSPVNVPSAPPRNNQDGSGMDLPSALNLLQMYPGTAQTPRLGTSSTMAVGDPVDGSNPYQPPPARAVASQFGQHHTDTYLPLSHSHPAFMSDRVSVSDGRVAQGGADRPAVLATSALSISPTSSGPSPSSTSPPPNNNAASSRPRRHSRSSIHEFSPLSPTFAMSPASASQPLEPHRPSARSTSPQTSSRPPSFSAYNWERDAAAVGISMSRNGSNVPPPATAKSRESSQSPVSSKRPSLSRRSSKNSDGANNSLSRSVSNADLVQMTRTFHGRPRMSRTSSRQGAPNFEDGADLTAVSQTALTNADGMAPQDGPTRSEMRSRKTSYADLKTILQQKRRQASAPFAKPVSATNSASTSPQGSRSPLKSSGGSASTPADPLALQQALQQPWEMIPARRTRSRRNTAADLGDPDSQIDGSTRPTMSNLGMSFEEARMQSLRGLGSVVMTPTVEEWQQLGMTEDLENASGSDSDSSGSSSDGFDEERHRAGKDVHTTPRGTRIGTVSSVNQFYGSAPPSNHAQALKQNYTSPELHKFTPSYLRHGAAHQSINELQSDMSSSENDLDTDKDNGSPTTPVVRRKSGGFLPTLSRGSVVAGGARTSVSSGSTQLGTPATEEAPADTIRRAAEYTRSAYLPFRASSHTGSRVSSPLPLSTTGPIEPYRYSAVTGERGIHSFAVEGEAGKGAYGLVRKVREIGPDGSVQGPPLMLKYIVKQRILAGSYKLHRILGNIPLEIHVLDYIRRMYKPLQNGSSQDPIAAAASFQTANTPSTDSLASAAEADQPPATVGHPNLCGMLDFFEDAENYYLVMPCFGVGQDLFDYVDLAPTGLSVGESRSILCQITDAVAFLHSHGVVHRDIKDENIILDGKGGVQLIDFGSAAYFKEGRPYFDAFSGTLDFASPEVLRGERYGGKETDIWALGVLAYVIYVGECPFWSSEESVLGLAPGCRADIAIQGKADLVEAALSPSEDPIQARTEAMEGIDFIRQCLQVNASDRPSAIQLKQHRFLVGEGGWMHRRGWETAVEDSSGDELPTR